jgi:hypothetical protein
MAVGPAGAYGVVCWFGGATRCAGDRLRGELGLAAVLGSRRDAGEEGA